MDSLHIRQTDRISNGLCDTDFLPRPVYQGEVTLGEEDCQRYPRQSTTGTDVDDPRPGAEGGVSPYHHRVEDVVLEDLVDVPTGDDVDFRIPLLI